MKKLILNVTQEDIDNGIRLNLSSCPIALALKRELKYEVRVDIFPEKFNAKEYNDLKSLVHCIEVDPDSNKELYIKLTNKALKFIDRFDNKKGIVTPTKFRFYVPEEIYNG